MTRRELVTVTLNAWGGGTVDTVPLSGRVVEVRVPDSGTAWLVGGATDLTFTRVADGGTVLVLSNATAPFTYMPAPAYHTVAGVVAGTASVAGVPIDDHLRLVVAQGTANGSASVFVHVHD